MSDRPPIPESTLLALRQRCGFGCVLCGCPIYDVDHIRSWAEAGQHDIENLTLLCPTHHRQKTLGQIAELRVRRANEAPINRHRGHTAPHGWYFEGDECCFWFGDSRCFSVGTTEAFVGLMIDCVPMVGFRFHEGNLLLQLHLFDEMNQLILQAHEGQLVHRVDVWDSRIRGRELTIRDAPRRIRLRMRFEPPNTIRFLNGLFLLNGVAVLVGPRGFELLNLGWRWSFDDAATRPQTNARVQIAVSIGLQPEDAAVALRIPGVPRYRGIEIRKHAEPLRPPKADQGRNASAP